MALCTGVCDRDLVTDHPTLNDGDLLIGLRFSNSVDNTQGYVQLKDLFQKKNIHLNYTVPFRTDDGEEESFFFFRKNSSRSQKYRHHHQVANAILS
jgi:hypothetical protein